MQTTSGYALSSNSIAYMESANDWYRNMVSPVGRFRAVELHHVELGMSDREEDRGERSIWNTLSRRGWEEAEERCVAYIVKHGAFMVSMSRGEEEEDPAKRHERIACGIQIDMPLQVLHKHQTQANPRLLLRVPPPLLLNGYHRF
jgi:hypothetical protein